MASPIQHQLTIDQTADGDNNNTASREALRGPIIDADGWYQLGPKCKRYDIDLVGTDTAVFDVQVYKEVQDGSELPVGDPISFAADGLQGFFQEPTTYTAIKLKVENYSTGTLNAYCSLA
jgi:hypothetical protein